MTLLTSFSFHIAYFCVKERSLKFLISLDSCIVHNYKHGFGQANEIGITTIFWGPLRNPVLNTYLIYFTHISRIGNSNGSLSSCLDCKSFLVVLIHTSRFIWPCKSWSDARFGITQFVTPNTQALRHPGV